MSNFTNAIKLELLLMFSFFSIGDSLISQEKKIKMGEPAPTFVLKSIEDEYIYLRDFCGELRPPIKDKKQQVVIISFFATWCEPCHKEIADLTEVLGEFEDKSIQVLLINLKEDKSKVVSFLKNKNYPGIVLMDKYGIVEKNYGVISIPRLFVLSKDGKLAWETMGYQKNFKQEFRIALKKLFP